MLIGYARTSTVEQEAGLEAQERDLKAAGCEKVYREQVSSVAKRDQLAAVMENLRKGDVLVVTKLDRLARSMRDLWDIIDKVTDPDPNTKKPRKGNLRILNFAGETLDTASASSRLMLNVLGSVAQFEREIMLERQREGIAKAKREGKYKGRKPTALEKADEVHALKAKGLGAAEIAKLLDIGRSSVYRLLAEASASA
jgi:DNA invertase Pin-like site-specific DNA recombinase